MQEEGEDKEKGGGDKLKALVSKYGKVSLYLLGQKYNTYI